MNAEKMNQMKATVLIVDDIPVNLNLLRGILEPEGYKILGATSGETALRIAARTIPDLILLDVVMQGLDGFETCRRLKAEPSTADVPVIFVTAKTEPEEVVRGFRVGGVDYITKPIQKEEVLVRVETHLRINRLAKMLSQKNEELEQRTAELEEALAHVKTLSGLIPICANCKKIRDDDGYWHHLELYIQDHSEALFSHGICPECAKKLYPDFYKEK